MCVVTIRTKPLMVTRVMIKKIKICTGPGCSAWEAELIVKNILNMKNGPEVVPVTCMDKCGGGCSIRVKDRGKIFKLREIAEARKLVKGEIKSLVEAC